MDRKEPQVLIEKLSRDEKFRFFQNRILKGDYPLELAETENSFLALVVAAMRQKNDKHFFIVLPTDQEA